MARSTQPTGTIGNSAAANTAIQPLPAALSRPRGSATAVHAHGLEDDPELYDVVLQRVRSAGETVAAEQILGNLDDCPTR